MLITTYKTRNARRRADEIIKWYMIGRMAQATPADSGALYRFVAESKNETLC